jgi:hypothetical protein
VPALRTNALTDGTGRLGAAHEAAPFAAAPLALTASAALTLPPATLSAATPSLSAATWHGEYLLFEGAGKVPPDDLAKIAGDERDYPDSVRGDHRLRGAGYRAAHECIDAELRETKPLAFSAVVRERLLGLADDPPPLRHDDVDLSRHVEHRRDSMIPDRECRFHAKPDSRAEPIP